MYFLNRTRLWFNNEWKSDDPLENQNLGEFANNFV